MSGLQISKWKLEILWVEERTQVSIEFSELKILGSVECFQIWIQVSKPNILVSLKCTEVQKLPTIRPEKSQMFFEQELRRSILALNSSVVPQHVPLATLASTPPQVVPTYKYFINWNICFCTVPEIPPDTQNK